MRDLKRSQSSWYSWGGKLWMNGDIRKRIWSFRKDKESCRKRKILEGVHKMQVRYHKILLHLVLREQTILLLTLRHTEHSHRHRLVSMHLSQLRLKMLEALWAKREIHKLNQVQMENLQLQQLLSLNSLPHLVPIWWDQVHIRNARAQNITVVNQAEWVDL